MTGGCLTVSRRDLITHQNGDANTIIIMYKHFWIAAFIIRLRLPVDPRVLDVGFMSAIQLVKTYLAIHINGPSICWQRFVLLANGLYAKT